LPDEVVESSVSAQVNAHLIKNHPRFRRGKAYAPEVQRSQFKSCPRYREVASDLRKRGLEAA
jgi:hypothetical protein